MAPGVLLKSFNNRHLEKKRYIRSTDKSKNESKDYTLLTFVKRSSVLLLIRHQRHGTTASADNKLLQKQLLFNWLVPHTVQTFIILHSTGNRSNTVAAQNDEEEERGKFGIKEDTSFNIPKLQWKIMIG